MRKTLITSVASLALHTALIAWARLPVAAADSPAAMPPLPEPVDRWSGNTAELSGERLVDVNVDPASPLTMGLQAERALDPAPASPANAPPPPATKPEVPALAPAVATAPKRASPPATDAPRAERPPRRPLAGSAGAGLPSATQTGGAGAGNAGSFGEEGPGSVRDLGRAFTRAIPPACQADPIWSKLPPGDAGAIDVAITIGETGHIEGFEPVKKENAPKHLLALVKRTLALLDAGTFAVRSGTVSAGVEVIRIRATLADVDASETGGAAGLSFTYARGKGKAGFTQPSGRHVDVSVEVVRVSF